LTVEAEISSKFIESLDRNDPRSRLAVVVADHDGGRRC
jgi:hypothetical protein